MMNGYYWKWKSTIIDFSKLSNIKLDWDKYTSKIEYVLYYLGIPDENENYWENGRYSTEYNRALEYAFDLNLLEKIEN